MFPFDHSALPQLTTRKALIAIDFQNDFLAQDGALSVTEPEGLINRTVKLASAFRDVGDVVWVQSQFDSLIPIGSEQIITTDSAPAPRPSSRGRRGASAEPADSAGPPDAEAFLSHPEPTCVKPGTPGCDMFPVIKDAVQKRDMTLVKSHYSAFKSTHLLRMLRAKMVMELFICGSLANVGVYATALDAAGHGMAITVVEDCCGFRSDQRQTKAISGLIELTGCEVASCEEVFELIHPKGAKQPKTPTKPLEPLRKSDTGEGTSRKSETPEFTKNMSRLRLASDSPSPAGAQPQPQAKKASTTCTVAEQHDTPNGPSKPAESEAIQVQDPGKVSTKEDDAASYQDETDTQKNLQQKAAPPASVAETTVATPTTSPTSPSLNELASKNDMVAEEIPALGKENSSTTPDMKDTKPPETESEDGQLHQRGLCEGDTDVIEDLLPESLADGIFDKLREEVCWQRMSHQGGEVPRLVAVQGEVASDGSLPIYRHPSDESPALLPFSPTVLAIKEETEKHLGHPLNHALIQFYRDSNDYISEHSDKTLDIVRGSYIANISLGAERTMVLRTKRLDKDPSRSEQAPADTKRRIQRARLPHNSLCRMGLQTNMKWLHAIRQDKRADREKSSAELAYNGGRISLTFRQIGTFLDGDGTIIWGQGATRKTREEAQLVISGQTPEAIKMLKAFGTENHSSEFDWDAHYGKGFDVLHITNAPRLFASSDPIVNMRISLMLAEYGVDHAKGSMGPTIQARDTVTGSDGVAIKFVDNDPDKATIQGDLAIMLYLDARYGQGKTEPSRTPLELATQLTRFQQGLRLLDQWRNLPKTEDKRDLKPLKTELTTLASFVGESEGAFLAGSKPSLPDFAVWPILHALVEESGLEALGGLDDLKRYYEMLGERSGAKKVLGKGESSGACGING